MDQRIQRAAVYLESHVNQRMSLGTMARVAGMSPSYFRHKFKEELGVTPTIYLQSVRLKMAKALLADNGLSVKQVKAAVGIQSDSYFTHQFKTTYGLPPSRLRSDQNGIPADILIVK